MFLFSLYLLYVNYNNEKIVTDNKIAFDKKIEENINKNSLVIQNISREIANNKYALSEINNNLNKIAEFACRENSEIHFLPFKITPKDIIEVISNYEKQEIKV